MFLANNLNKGGGAAGYQISRSLRFNSADSAYLNRTPASAGNRRTWTFSTWVKRSQLSSGNAMLATVNGSALNYFAFGTSTGDFLAYAYFDGASDVFGVNTSGTSVFRDVSAWYHIVLSVDTTQATAANRVKIYVNNVEQTLGGTYPTQNYDTPINNTISNLIGGATGSYTAYLSDQYMTEVNFIDGQQLTPSSFGETNAQTGVWQPKAYSGSYGTNGFYLNFSDNSNTTAATLGKDYSGNGNNWTPNNFSVTAGVDNDSMVDVPTPYGVDTGVGGEVRGNYCTINPLDGVGSATITEGNLKFANTSNATFRGTLGVTGSSGKWYWEFTQQTAVTSLTPISYGISTLQGPPSHSASARSAYYYTDVIGKYLVVYINGVQTLVVVATAIGINDVLQFAYDSDTGKVWVGKSGVWSDSTGGTTGNPATGANATYTFASVDQPMAPTLDHAGVAYTATLNCGQRAFVNTAPSGFKALCTQNLPTPTIGATTATQAGKYYNAVLWTGNNSYPRAITGVGFQPDFVWGKSRSNNYGHILYDAVRGSGATKSLVSNNTNAEGFDSAYTNLSSFDSDGFSLGTSSAFNVMNASGLPYVAWNWKANGSGSSNTAGSITSTVSASTTSGFSVVTYTGTGANATVGHGLGAAPSIIIFKNRSAVTNWVVYNINATSAAASARPMYLNTINGEVANGAMFNHPSTNSSTIFNIGTDSTTNGSGNSIVAYCFTPIAGYFATNIFTGNGSADGPFVYCGFRPAYVLIKDTTNNGAWFIWDTARDTYNVSQYTLLANSFDAETSGSANYIDILSNGFKIKATTAGFNTNTDKFLFMAFASSPFKYSLAR